MCIYFLIVLCLQCHKCPPREHRSAKACLAGPPEECQPHHTGCFFEYNKRNIKLGCGRDWARPAGCDGTICISWCTNKDLCNEMLLRREAPFELDLKELPTTEGPMVLSYEWFESVFNSSPRLGEKAWVLRYYFPYTMALFMTILFYCIL